MNKPKGVLILGFGGHARSVANVALSSGIKDLLFVDDNAKDNENFLGFSVLKNFVEILPVGWVCIPASGDNEKRKAQFEYAMKVGWQLGSIISPYATIGVGTIVPLGCFIAHHVHIGPLVQLGVGCIINTGALIEHDCVIGDYTHISVNSTVAGGSQVGNAVFIGAGAIVIDKVMIGDKVTIGAGGLVISTIEKQGVYVGMPVFQINKKTIEV